MYIAHIMSLKLSVGKLCTFIPGEQSNCISFELDCIPKLAARMFEVLVYMKWILMTGIVCFYLLILD